MKHQVAASVGAVLLFVSDAGLTHSESGLIVVVTFRLGLFSVDVGFL